jgi:CO/xanthine dehydrogenase Mo-binding subunit
VGSQGQGQETTLAQIVADRLGVRVADVAVTTGDSDAFGWGCGTYASRAAVTAGNAVALAAERVAAMAREAAAPALEAAAEDLELADGAVHVKGARDRAVSLAELAVRTESSFISPGAVPPARPGLEAEMFFYSTRAALAAGGHACLVEVDVETGAVRLLKYVVAHDCGRTLNPMIVEGQVMGGVAQGISGALLERLVYDEAGQLLSGTLMDYALVRADDLPPIVLSHRESPSAHNPLGVKGVGESGTIAGHAVIAGATLAASELRELIRRAQAAAGGR